MPGYISWHTYLHISQDIFPGTLIYIFHRIYFLAHLFTYFTGYISWHTYLHISQDIFPGTYLHISQDIFPGTLIYIFHRIYFLAHLFTYFTGYISCCTIILIYILLLTLHQIYAWLCSLFDN